MTVADIIHTKLTEALEPDSVDIVDESHKHKGHAGYREGGESHFQVTVVSAGFEGQNRIARQRTVYDILSEELAGPIHALSLKLMTPGEASEQER